MPQEPALNRDEIRETIGAIMAREGTAERSSLADGSVACVLYSGGAPARYVISNPEDEASPRQIADRVQKIVVEGRYDQVLVIGWGQHATHESRSRSVAGWLLPEIDAFRAQVFDNYTRDDFDFWDPEKDSVPSPLRYTEIPAPASGPDPAAYTQLSELPAPDPQTVAQAARAVRVSSATWSPLEAARRAMRHARHLAAPSADNVLQHVAVIGALLHQQGDVLALVRAEAIVASRDREDQSLRTGLVVAALHAAPEHRTGMNALAAEVLLATDEPQRGAVLLDRASHGAGPTPAGTHAQQLLAAQASADEFAAAYVTPVRQRYPRLTGSPSPSIRVRQLVAPPRAGASPGI